MPNDRKGSCANCGHIYICHSPLCGWRNSQGKRCDCTAFVAALTARETTVLLLYANMTSRKDVANALGISYRTVEVHLKSIRRKTGANSTLEVILTAIRCGVVKIESLPDRGLIIFT